MQARRVAVREDPRQQLERRLPRVGAGERVIGELQERRLRLRLDVHAALAFLPRLLRADRLGRRVRRDRLEVLPRQRDRALRLDVADQDQRAIVRRVVRGEERS